jgi:hypothetical protein
MSQDVMVVDTGITAAILSGFLGFHGNIVEDAVFLGCGATLLGNCSPTFRDHYVISKRWASNHPVTRRHIPEKSATITLVALQDLETGDYFF